MYGANVHSLRDAPDRWRGQKWLSRNDYLRRYLAIRVDADNGPLTTLLCLQPTDLAPETPPSRRVIAQLTI